MLTTLPSKIQNLKSKTQNLLPWLALLLVVIGQLNYLPARLDSLHQWQTFARAQSQDAARLAYGVANYELLVWLEQNTPPETTLLLLTASPRAYGDPAYVLYHRAIYHLYPRNVWWAAPVPPAQVPSWWLPTDLTEANILNLTQKYHITAILADGFARPPISGSVASFDADTHLIFLADRRQGSVARSQKSEVSNQSSLAGRQSLIGGLFLSLGAIFSIWVWGDWVYSLSRKPTFSRSLAWRMAAAWLLGCGLTSLGTFFLLWVGVPLIASVISLSLLGILLWLHTHYPTRRVAIPSTLLRASLASPLRLLYALIITLQVGFVAFAAWVSPLTDWDAWLNWASKANALFMDQTLLPNIVNNPARLPTNMDYPLLLPLVEAWFYTWLGHIHEPAINFISLLFYLALLLLFYQAARLLASPTAAFGFTALLATIPRLERPASSGLADIPLAALIFLSFFLLIQLFKEISPLPPRSSAPLPVSPCPRAPVSSSHLLLLALSTGLLPWIKNEGWLWWGLISLSLWLGLALQIKRQELSGRQAALFFLLYSLPALLTPLLWQVFLTMFGTYRFTFLPLTLATFWTNLPRLPLIGWHILTRLLNPYWNFIWLLVGLTLVSRRGRSLVAPEGWLILPIIGYLGLVSLTYVFSRFDPFLAHLNNSAERLILQATPLALWWLLGQSVALGWVRNKEDLKETEGI